ncbi:MAG: hypothetical protein HQ580_18505 [Planctomycetes bacterium]|nr:hypothetical protein [Planctomycetota bacterium]
MRKIISCKVIRTIPLSKSSNGLHHTSRSNVRSHNISDAVRTPSTNKCAWEISSNAQVKDSSKSVVYTNRLDITRMPIHNGLTAPTVNCYA